jgi:hypothetical protein
VAFQGGAYGLDITNSDSTVGPLDVSVDDGLNIGGLQGYVLAWLGDSAFGLEADARFIQGDITTNQVFADMDTEVSEDDIDPNADPDDLAETLLDNLNETETYDQTGLDLRAGLRYRRALSGPLTAFGLAQVHRQAATLYLWDEAEVIPVELPLLGARVGGGFIVETRAFWLDAQVAESFAPYPVLTEVEARMNVHIQPALALHLGGGMAWRNMTFEVDGAELTYHDDTAYFSLGIGTALR